MKEMKREVLNCISMYQQNVLQPSSGQAGNQQNRKRAATNEWSNQMPAKRWDGYEQPYIPQDMGQQQHQQSNGYGTIEEEGPWMPYYIEDLENQNPQFQQHPNQQYMQYQPYQQCFDPQMAPPAEMMNPGFVDQYNQAPMMHQQAQAQQAQMLHQQNWQQQQTMLQSVSPPIISVTPPLADTSSNTNTSLGASSTLNSTPEVRNSSLNTSASNTSVSTSNVSLSPTQIEIGGWVPIGSEGCKPMISDGDAVLATVGGRFAMVGNLTKYKLRVEEVRRRVGAPEYMNSSALSCLFRKAKKKNGSEDMRNMLSNQYGIDLKTCQRQGLANTAFTPMLEEEAAVLAKDIDVLTSRHFPKDDLAEQVMMLLMEAGHGHYVVMDIVEKCLRFMQRISVHAVVVEPKTSGRPEILCEDPKLNEFMKYLSLRTHGFAIINQKTYIRELFEVTRRVQTRAFNMYNQWQMNQQQYQHNPHQMYQMQMV